MIKLKELVINDLNSFNSIEMAKLYNFMQVMKDKRQIPLPQMNTSYLKVRESLQVCAGSLSEEIMREREEAL